MEGEAFFLVKGEGRGVVGVYFQGEQREALVDGVLFDLLEQGAGHALAASFFVDGKSHNARFTGSQARRGGAVEGKRGEQGHRKRKRTAQGPKGEVQKEASVGVEPGEANDLSAGRSF